MSRESRANGKIHGLFRAGRQNRPLIVSGTIFLILVFPLFYSVAPLLPQTDLAFEWHLLYLKIRDGFVSKGEAHAKLKQLETSLKNLYVKSVEGENDDLLFFPLEGYHARAIGGKQGSGYQPYGYDFFDGNRHKGHPAHDIFIRDKNQDGLDDMTEKPVEVISASSGIVVSINLDWESPDPIRGGNYIWTYEPIKGRYYYYAHLDRIFVKIGQGVSKETRLGTVGRTGVNAHSKRSPTHLHFTVLESKEGYPKPINPYKELLTGRG